MEIPFELDVTTNHIKVPVYVNGQGPFLFTLDTGAVATTISQTLATKLKITSSDPKGQPKHDIGIPIQEAKLNHLKIGSKIFEDEDVLVIDFKQRLGCCVNEIGGVIGHSTLKHFKTSIDYHNNLLKLKEGDINNGEEQDNLTWSPFEYIPNTHLVGIPVKINGHGPFPFALDTGAGGTVIALNLAKQLNLDLNDFEGECRGIGGGTKGYVTEIKQFSVEGAQLENLPVLVIDLNAITPKAELISNGILGYPFLKNFKVIIDYPNKKFSFKTP